MVLERFRFYRAEVWNAFETRAEYSTLYWELVQVIGNPYGSGSQVYLQRSYSGGTQRSPSWHREHRVKRSENTSCSLSVLRETLRVLCLPEQKNYPAQQGERAMFIDRRVFKIKTGRMQEMIAISNAERVRIQQKYSNAGE